jgi:hypothetical protein
MRSGFSSHSSSVTGHEKVKRTMKRYLHCGEPVHRVKRYAWEMPFSALGLYPFRCASCLRRIYRRV